MSYLLVEDFKFGLDSRRFKLNAPPGTLTALTNGHITPGGEIEKRKAFSYTAFTSGTPDTFGLEVTSAGLVTFGSVAEGSLSDTLPEDVTYVQLAHPDGTSAMVGVIHSTVYNGAAFVIADYGAGGILSWYDGTIVDDLSPGKLAIILADAEALATYIAAQIDATDTYSASASAGTVTVTGPTGQTFSVSAPDPVPTNCTTPLDTDPPDVEGVAITAMTFETTAHTMTGSPVSQVFLPFVYNTSGGGANELTTGSPLNANGPNPNIAGLYNTDGTATDDSDMIAGYSPAAILYGGAGRTLSLSSVPSGGVPGTTYTGSFRITITYANGATKIITDSWDDTDNGGAGTTLGPYTLNADPPEVTPTITTSVVSDGVQPVSGTIPQTQFTVIAVNPSGSGVVTSITVGGEEVLTDTSLARSGTNYDTPALLATALKNQINTYCTANNKDFTASVTNNIVVIRATDPTGYAALSGATVAVTVDDDVCIGNGAVRFSRASVTDPTWTALSIDGADQLGGTVNWNTDMTTSVQDVATQFNSNSTVYTAVASGSTLYVSKLVTSSDDEALQISPAGTNLNWEGANPGGGNTGTSGGTFPGTIDLATDNIALRLYDQYNLTGYLTNLSVNAAVIVGGGLPPYNYKWEVLSGGDLQYSYALFNTNEIDIFTSPRSATTAIRVDAPGIRYNGGRNTAVVRGYQATIRCQITDSLNRIGYSPTINVHFP